ncbi:hypothetical protein B6N60_03224 [Richelia sinica FACHB-800]|uniref:HNH domain-containing protein n=1 Tax=Richelia sinica FACHB-800 TaxID=1357546 RepID=A0A975T9I4_9NOST|nr:HNH endonuclease signature motif containing protein [Richelia sinica]MBD2663347.1 HNH endonuclease [Richelia sinica FACHB-800]QXE24519.1 hypothetical protein B6N60_03224 [Richelia sinica FACHB-800]
MDLGNKQLGELFKLIDKVGKTRYHKLTDNDFDNYKKFDIWRYVNGDAECGTTEESKEWVRKNSDWYCPICGYKYSERGGKTIDHKLPRSQYPWLSMEFNNLWVICRDCNQEKGEMHWYEYERYIFVNYPHLYEFIKTVRPTTLLRSLKS